MADSPSPETSTSHPTTTDSAGADGGAAVEPASRADVAGLAHQVRTEMAHLRRDLASRIDAAGERLEAALGRRHTRLGLALIAAQCLVTVLSVAVVRLTG